MQCLVATGLDLQLDVTVARGPYHRIFDQVGLLNWVPAITCYQEFQRICGLRRDPTQPPLDPLPMVAAVNGLTNNAFNPNAPECALEFIFAVLDNLELVPRYLATYEEVGDCVMCQAPYRQVC